MLIFSTRLGSRGGSEAVYDLLKYAYWQRYAGEFPEIKKTPNGKPYFPDRPDIHFSLSHTMSHVMCAISDRLVGCDIEAADREVSNRALRFFASSEEQEMFDPLDLWLLKESYIKLIGGTLATIKQQRFQKESGRIIPPDASVSAKLYSIDGCRAAVCGIGAISASIELI
ncbi:MAG: hypothetical protein FWB97_01430 [Oscillospiraceae bacterium]|nr:hypothetical protein [Oscillospiraceae bacterium]